MAWNAARFHSLCAVFAIFAMTCHTGYVQCFVTENKAFAGHLLGKDGAGIEAKLEGSAEHPDGASSFDSAAAKLANELGESLGDSEGDIEGTIEDFHSVPMPTDFRSYDVLVPDGYISLEELINVTGAVENVREAFQASDIDGDGLLTEAEFDTAPWMLSGDTLDNSVPPSVDHKLDKIPEDDVSVDITDDVIQKT